MRAIHPACPRDLSQRARRGHGGIWGRVIDRCPLSNLYHIFMIYLSLSQSISVYLSLSHSPYYTG